MKLLVWVLGALLIGSLSAATDDTIREPVTGKAFAARIQGAAPGVSLVCTGAACRTKTALGAKVYAIAHWIDPAAASSALAQWKGKTGAQLASDQAFFNALCSADAEKRLELVFVRSVDAADTQSTYFLSHFVMPAESTLTFHSRIPRARYFQFALYKAEHNTFVSIGEALRGPDIEPDAGSVNPFRVGADRHADNRDCTLRIVAEDPPNDPARHEANTMYVGRDGGELQGVIRIYLPDNGWDGAGGAPLDGTAPDPPFRYEATLADGTQRSQEEVVRRFAKPMKGATKPPISADQWAALVRSKENDPAFDLATAPARRTPQWEKYWGIPYSILGAFKSPEERAKIPHGGAIDGGGDPSTRYFLALLSREFGPVYVMTGRMPTLPDTFADPGGEGLATMPETRTQYWSLVSCEAPPSGRIVDGVCDMQVPLDPDRNYTIVFSRAEDRPVNATIENGVAWLEWSPRGEGLDHPQNRENYGMLMLRIMATNPDWEARPDNVTTPGSKESVMGDDLPRGRYMTKEEFEAGKASAHSR